MIRAMLVTRRINSLTGLLMAASLSVILSAGEAKATEAGDCSDKCWVNRKGCEKVAQKLSDEAFVCRRELEKKAVEILQKTGQNLKDRQKELQEVLGKDVDCKFLERSSNEIYEDCQKQWWLCHERCNVISQREYEAFKKRLEEIRTKPLP